MSLDDMSSYDRLYTTCTSSLPTEPLLRALALCSSNAADPCFGVDCGEHGSCAGGTCQCEAGYSGAACAVADPCAGVDCGGHGQCVGGGCQCEQWYSGAACAVVDPCMGVDCGEHGQCVDGSCQCQPGYSGSACSEKVAPSWLRQENGQEYLVLTGTGRRYNTLGGNNPCQATTTYTAARFDHIELYIDTTDRTFAIVAPESGSGCSSGGGFVGFSEVSMCDWTATATATVDLSGTPFAIDLARTQDTYTGMGYQSQSTISCSDGHNQVCSFACTGACGSCRQCASPNDATGGCDAGDDHQLPLAIIDEAEFARAFQ